MNLGFSETAFLVVLGLLLFGPKKLPEIGRQIGRIMAEFKRASAEFQSQLTDEVRQLEQEIDETKNMILPAEGSTSRLERSAPPPSENIPALPDETPEEPAGSSEALSRAVIQEPNA